MLGPVLVPVLPLQVMALRLRLTAASPALPRASFCLCADSVARPTGGSAHGTLAVHPSWVRRSGTPDTCAYVHTHKQLHTQSHMFAHKPPVHVTHMHTQVPTHSHIQSYQGRTLPRPRHTPMPLCSWAHVSSQAMPVLQALCLCHCWLRLWGKQWLGGAPSSLSGPNGLCWLRPRRAMPMLASQAGGDSAVLPRTP